MVVVVARNIRRGGLHYAHLWMVGADTEPVGLGLSASMVEFGISTILENAWGKKQKYILMLQIKMNSVQEMCGTNKNLMRVIESLLMTCSPIPRLTTLFMHCNQLYHAG